MDGQDLWRDEGSTHHGYASRLRCVMHRRLLHWMLYWMQRDMQGHMLNYLQRNMQRNMHSNMR